jgi:hypothetical protein
LMAMPWEWLCFVFALVWHVAPIDVKRKYKLLRFVLCQLLALHF